MACSPTLAWQAPSPILRVSASRFGPALPAAPNSELPEENHASDPMQMLFTALGARLTRNRTQPPLYYYEMKNIT